MADFVFSKALEMIAKGTIDLDSHTFKLALVDDTAAPDPDVDESWNPATTPNVGESELAGENGYSTGGKTLSHISVSRSNGVVKWDNTDDSDTQWTNATFTARYGIIYDDTTNPKYLVVCLDFGGNKSVTAGTFQINMNASGIMTIE
jgi:hypothetical protein